MSGGIELTPVQRAAALERIGESLALRSGAGCGKTLVLAHRFTELLSASDAEDPLSRFVALTFTDKAALEMQQRARRLLAEKAAASKGERRRRLLGWLEELPAARISTIHSFCAAVLRAHAIEAGVDPNFAVCADQIVTGEMLDEAADEALLAAVEAQRPDVTELLGRMHYDRLVDLVRRLVDCRTAWSPEDYADPDATLVKWRDSIAKVRKAAQDRLACDADLRRQIDTLAAEPCSDPDDKLLAIRDELVGAMRHVLEGAASWSAKVFAPFVNFKTGSVGSDKAWGNKGSAKRIRDRLRTLAEALAKYAPLAEEPGEPDKAAARALSTMAGLAREAGALYAAAKRSRGILDFTDLLALTGELLSASPPVRKALAAGLDQLLVDECQDTDAFQVELLSSLAWAGAKGVAPPVGRLFLVGDKKQSIYRFRGAQVEVFDELCARMGPKNRETLDLSFRTHESGVEFVNELFAPLMGDDYAPIRAHRKERPPQPSVEIILAEPSDDRPLATAGDASDLQAAATAQRIAEMIENQERLVWDDEREGWRPVRPGDVAILFARMTHSVAYERQLVARGVGYYVVAGTGFFQRQEVFDVLNGLRAVENPFDDVAFFGVLRSGMFGLDDAALMHVAESVKAPRLLELSGRKAVAAAGLSRAENETLAFAVALLVALNRQKDAIPMDAIIERLLAATGYEATLLAQFNGRQMLGNVRRLVQLARSAAADGATTGEFLAQMSEQIIDQSRFEQAPVAGEAEDVVRLMTIHKAKGLEFPVVFVPDLNFAYRGVREALLNRLDLGLTLNLEGGDDQQEGGEPAEAPLAFRIAKLLEEEDQRREDIRKLYVAATRHKDHLAFVAADWRGKDGAFRSGGSYINTMAARLGIAAAADAGRNIPYGGGRFEAAVRKLTPSPAAGGPPRRSAGRRILRRSSSAEQVAAAISRRAAARAPRSLGPIGGDVGKAELAATALAEFEYCPMLYHWRYELRVPVAGLGREQTRPRRPPETLDAASLGTLYHRCMELLDFAAPQPAEALVAQAAAETQIEETADVGALAGELESMLAAFRKTALWGRLAGARRTLRELQFVLKANNATLGGQIDLLCQDDGGAWHIVDYKSDRIDDEGLEPHARRYELQMLIYAAAAGRHLGGPPADAVLYFLRPAAEHVLELSGEAIAAAESRIEKVAAELIKARRSGNYARNESGACGSCPYGPLCNRQH